MDDQDIGAIGGLPDELILHAAHAAGEHHRIDVEATQNLRQLADVAKRIGDIAHVHPFSKLAAHLRANQQVADRRLAGDEKLVGQNVPWTDLDAPALHITFDLGPVFRPDRQIVVQGDGLPVEHKVFVFGIGVKNVQQLVDQQHQPDAKFFKWLVPFAVPVGV